MRPSAFRMAGQEVAVLLWGWRRSGDYALAWDGRDGAGAVQTQVTPHLEARVYFSSPTLVFDLALDVLPHNWERLD